MAKTLKSKKSTRQQVPPARCPKCVSERVVPIMYGLPSDELFEDWDRGEVELGGCCI